MNIEPGSERLYRRLVPPSQASQSRNNSNKLPGPNSKNILVNGYNFGFKAYLAGKKVFFYRCSQRRICSCLIHIPLDENYDENYELKNSRALGVNYRNSHLEECISKINSEKLTRNAATEVQSHSSNVQILEDYIRKIFSFFSQCTLSN